MLYLGPQHQCRRPCSRHFRIWPCPCSDPRCVDCQCCRCGEVRVFASAANLCDTPWSCPNFRHCAGIADRNPIHKNALLPTGPDPWHDPDRISLRTLVLSQRLRLLQGEFRFGSRTMHPLHQTKRPDRPSTAPMAVLTAPPATRTTGVARVSFLPRPRSSSVSSTTKTTMAAAGNSPRHHSPPRPSPPRPSHARGERAGQAGRRRGRGGRKSRRGIDPSPGTFARRPAANHPRRPPPSCGMRSYTTSTCSPLPTCSCSPSC